MNNITDKDSKPDHINKYYHLVTTNNVTPITILDIFNVTNKHLRQAFINIITNCNDNLSISNIADVYLNTLFPQFNIGNYVDVYDVLKCLNITDPSLQHAVKKIMCAGQRGHKDLELDLYEIISALSRYK